LIYNLHPNHTRQTTPGGDTA